MEMYADEAARGGILEPPGICEIKFRAADQKKVSAPPGGTHTSRRLRSVSFVVRRAGPARSLDVSAKGFWRRRIRGGRGSPRRRCTG